MKGLRARCMAWACALATATAAVSGAGARGVGATPPPSLQATLVRAVEGSPGLAHVAVSLYVEDLQTRQVLAALNPDWKLVPGSVVKLFTSAQALSQLGPSFRYQTRVEVAGPPSDPTVYLVGGGDPWLEANGALTLEALARRLHQRYRTVDRVVGVSTAFGPAEPGVGWAWDDLTYAYASPAAALTSERDELHVVVTPGLQVGAPVRVALNPGNPSVPIPPSYLGVDNQGVTAPSFSPNTLEVVRPLGSGTVRITGQLPLGAPPVDVYVSVPHPALLTATLLSRLLVQDGTEVRQGPTTGSLPPGARTVLTLTSQPLRKDLQIQNTYSVNLMAENLWREAGRKAGTGGTSFGAQRASQAFLQAHGLPADVVWVDGSGLSPLDEMSSRQVVRLLAWAYRQSWFPVFLHSLIHVGRTDQCSFLCGLMDGTPADGRVWLKTGNLGNQWNYAGYAQSQGGHLLAFAILVDGLPAGPDLSQALPAMDTLVEDIAAWPLLPPQAPLPPALPPPVPPVLRRYLPSTAGNPLVSAALVALPSGRLVWGDHPDLPVRAVGVARLAVALLALEHLPSRLTGARLYLVGRREGAVWVGSLVLWAQEDPLLSGPDLIRLAAMLRTQGIRSVVGSVEVVSQPYPTWEDTGRWPPGIPWELLDTLQAPPTAAAATDEDMVTLQAQGTRPGAPAQLLAPAGVPVENRVLTSPHPVPLTATWDAQTGSLVVSGDVAMGQKAQVKASAPDPAYRAAMELKADLLAQGIAVGGGVRRLPALPPGAALGASLPSLPLATVVQDALTSPSPYLTLRLYGLLGPSAAQELAALLGPTASVPDPSGVGLEDYLSAQQVAQLLAALWRWWAARGSAPTWLGWNERGVEMAARVGFVRAQGVPYAYAILQAGLPPDPKAPNAPPDLLGLSLP